MKTLLIVESPAKSKTIEKLLGPNYVVKASFGHIRDLISTSENPLGIEVENQFRPIYQNLPKSAEHIKELKATMARVDRVLLASDEDREGEAIAWHCAVVLKLPLNTENRICFHEITETALRRAVENPRRIDMNMVNSQQTRRVLDRLVGFELSPLLNVIKRKLSAGRVQSVCLKIIVEKEMSIAQFEERKYFKTIGYFKPGIVSSLNQTFTDNSQVETFLNQLKDVSEFVIESIDSKRIERRPPPPYTTSTIQQDIGSRLRIPSKILMNILQHLYESGKITYHRTDSTLLSDHIMKEIKAFVLGEEDLGKPYHHPRVYKTKTKSAQEAHEAIRPTSIFMRELDETFDSSAQSVYQMIWRRTVASQMSNFVYDLYTMIIGWENSGEQKFEATVEKIIFDGFKKIYDDTPKREDDNDDDGENVTNSLFGDVKVGDRLINEKIVSTEKYQNPPPRYSEATIIKKMEVAGIGRPSTYAKTLETLFERDYVEKKNIPGKKKKGLCWILDKEQNNLLKNHSIDISIGGEKGKLTPTELGKRVNEFLMTHFATVINEEFTSVMENKLDEVANGNMIWNNVVDECYQSFHPIVSQLNSSSASLSASNSQRIQKRNIGEYDGKNVYVYQSINGPLYQIGEDKDKKKKYVELREGDTIEGVSMEEFMETIQNSYPRNITEYNGIPILLCKSKNGLYLSFNGNNIPIKEGIEDKENITEEQAISCLNIIEEINDNGEKIELILPIKHGKYIINTGKYGNYVQLDKVYVNIPTHVKIHKMNVEICKELVDNKKKMAKTATTKTGKATESTASNSETPKKRVYKKKN